MKRLLVLVAVVAAAAFVPAAAGDGGPSPGVAMGWTGVLSPDGAKRYVTMSTSRDTIVAEIATRSGRVQRWGLVKGVFGVPLVAYDGTTAGMLPDGRTLILARPLLGQHPRTSTFLFYDLKRLRVRDRLAVRGAFSFDAISPSRRTLYLIEHVTPVANPTRYRVRAYDLRTRRLLDAAIRDRRNRHSTMNGMPYARTSSGDGVWVYTLYGGAKHAFVHALNTERRDAICIGLPWSGTKQKLWQMRLSRRGSRLILRTRTGEDAATIDLGRFEVTKAMRL
jgi:hypothetical protein